MSSLQPTSPTTCKNCQTTFEGKFCPNCSQKADTHRFTLKHFGHEFLHALTHTDKGILFLIKELFIRPGKVAKEYVEGKRKNYFNPITFLLIMMALQIYASKKTDIINAYIVATEKFFTEISPNPADTKKSMEGGLKEFKQGSPKLLENSRLITFFLLPVLALLTWLFFLKSGYNYAENLILNIMLQGQANFIFLVICIIPFLLYPASVIIVLTLQQVVVWLYSIIAYAQFYGQRRWVTVLKGSMVMILYFIFTQYAVNLILRFV